MYMGTGSNGHYGKWVREAMSINVHGHRKQRALRQMGTGSNEHYGTLARETTLGFMVHGHGK